MIVTCLTVSIVVVVDVCGADGIMVPPGCLEVRAIREIRSGEEVRICYLGKEDWLLPAVERRAVLERRGFTCSCPACQGVEYDEFRQRLQQLEEEKELDEFVQLLGEAGGKVLWRLEAAVRIGIPGAEAMLDTWT